MFHMYDKNMYKRDVTCSWHPSPSVTNCHTLSDTLRAWRALWTALSYHWRFSIWVNIRPTEMEKINC